MLNPNTPLLVQHGFTSLEVCAGAGGQALGLEKAGFDHLGLVEVDSHCCVTLRHNRPDWNVQEKDLNSFDAADFRGIDLFAGGLPCPPFSVAGKRLGEKDERNLFPAALRVIEETKPKAIMIENVRGFLGAVFEDYRTQLRSKLEAMGYETQWRLFNSSDFGVPQVRPRVVIVALRHDIKDGFEWPSVFPQNAPTVGEAIGDLMGANGWVGTTKWIKSANEVAPTLVGGSKKHGGPDLGPTGAKKAWATLGVNGKSIADDAPERDFVGMPRLTVEMCARLQGFPSDWEIIGRKTAAYRQVGNAFPPPVAAAISQQISKAILSKSGKYYRMAS